MVHPTVLCLVLVAVVAPAAAKDFSRYLANDSLIGQPVPCTEAEKECLRYNRLLHKRHCYPLGHGPRGCLLFVERQELQFEGGHVRGECLSSKSSCPHGRMRMAYDGECVRYKEVVKICRGADDLEFAPHFFGDTECVRVGFAQPRPAFVAQPDEPGRCVFPNLRHDLTATRAEAARVGLRCTAAQSMCFAQGKVWLAALNTCVSLLEQGPCEEGQNVVLVLLDERGHRKMTAECQPRNPCKPNQRLMAFDGQCYDVSKIRTVLCPSGVLLPNAYGQYSCSGLKDMYKHVIVLESARAESCEIVHKVSHHLSGPSVRVVPDCSLSDAGECALAVNQLLRSAAAAAALPNELPEPEPERTRFYV